MTYKETLDYINSVRLNQWKLGLSRTRELLHMLGDPQDKLKFVHIGGTNGKGSTSAMIESVLRNAGYKTGLFPSPYLEEFRERIRVGGKKISEADLCRITEKVKAAADTMEDDPSHFEIVTAIGMIYFSEMKCDIVVLEVGLGGEFDATNIIKAPEVSVLTNIGFDHTDYLGTTLEEIARTKSGIIKSGSPVVLYPNVAEVTDVVSEICAERGCELTIADFKRMEPLDTKISGQTFAWDGKKIKLSLLGDYQMRNAALALTVIEILQKKGWKISEEDIMNGMASVKWPARFELLGANPAFILDGGHNSQCAAAIAESLDRYMPDMKLTFVIGMLRDKDYENALDILLPYASKCYCLTPDSNRAIYAEDLAEIIRSKGVEAEVFSSAEEAVERCFVNRESALAFGSLYMAGDVRRAYRNLLKKRIRVAKIAAREGLAEADRIAFSEVICDRIAETEEYKNAHTIFMYKCIYGEVKLDKLEERAAADGKRAVYPKRVDTAIMDVIEPGEGEDAWDDCGFCGIVEPVLEKGTVVDPEEIDLIVAPCTSFDEYLNRLGMGGAFYDCYIPRCKNAKVIAAAYEVQKSEKLPIEEHDQPVDAVATELKLYRLFR